MVNIFSRGIVKSNKIFHEATSFMRVLPDFLIIGNSFCCKTLFYDHMVQHPLILKNPIKFDVDYLQEKKHIGNQEYFKTNLEYTKGDNGIFAFEMKRNIITNSSEYYNLSYEYLNDCLRAGLVYRREFYNDSELEAENSLMFKITLTPFGDIKSPSFNK